MAKSYCYAPHLPIPHLSQHQHRSQNQNLVLKHKYPTSSLRPQQNLKFPTKCLLFPFPRQRRTNFNLNALHSDPHDQNSVKVGRNESYEQWDSLTSKFSGAANVPFLLLQMPQIILNTRNLMAGNPTALFAIPWLVGNPYLQCFLNF